MKSDFEKTPIFYVCNHCHQEGWFFLDSKQTTTLVLCSNCSHELAYAYCPTCDLMTNFLAQSTVQRPNSWTCSSCNTEYSLNPDFYENPARLYFEKDIPDDVRNQMQKRTSQHFTFLIIAIIIMVVLIIFKL